MTPADAKILADRKQSTDESPVRIRVFGHVLKIGTYTIAIGCISVAGWLWKGQTDQDAQLAVHEGRLTKCEANVDATEKQMQYMRQDQWLLMERLGVAPVTPPPISATQPGRP
jgi:hypothetical protein